MVLTTPVELVLPQLIPHSSQQACHPGGHFWDYYIGTLPLFQITATGMQFFAMSHRMQEGHTIISLVHDQK